MKMALPLAGEMGAGIGAVLVNHGNTVLTCLDGRSTATRNRAAGAGMQDAALADLAKAEVILSIVPPSIALETAERLTELLPEDAAPLYVDLNAVNPATASRIEAALPERVRFSDGSIIGAAPKAGHRVPRFYVSGPASSEALMLRKHGMDVVAMDGGVGAASALKMCYGALTKGTAAMTAAILMAAEREGIGAALHAELANSQKARLAAAEKTLPNVYAKAYRWVAEMEQIAGFLGEERSESGIWQSAGGLYQRIADDFDGSGAEIGAISRFLSRYDIL